MTGGSGFRVKRKPKSHDPRRTSHESRVAENKTILNFCTLIPVFLLACIPTAYTQDQPLKKLTLEGYISSMQSVIDMDSMNGYWYYESQIHNRLNISYFPTSRISMALQARNRFITGDRFKSDVEGINKKTLAEDAGFMDLSFNWATGRSYVLNTAIDRLYMKYSYNKLEITLGRQRVNWGQTYVWNPNDWFNTYSFFDFDYVERPGSDAVRIQYFTGAMSGAEFVAKIDSAGSLTAAGLYKFNRGSYDFQLLGGWLTGSDLALGSGWTGNIGQIGFRGEMSYFHPARHFSDTTGLFFVSLALDYTTSNSLMIQVEGFYNQLPPGYTGQSFVEFYQRPLSVKDLSFTEWNFMVQFSYPFTPLINASFATLWYPEISGYYLGPSFTCSLADNLDFSLFLQYFTGRLPGPSGTTERQDITLGFLRFKYSF